MKSRYTTTFMLLALLAATATRGQETTSLTLKEAQAQALKNNEQMKQADYDVEIARAKVRETTAIGLPQVNGEATMNYYIDIPTQVAEASMFDPMAPPNMLVPLQFGLPYSATAGISASQLIFDGSYFVGLKAAKAYFNNAELGREKTEIEVKNQVAQTYFAVLALSETIETLKENKRTVDQNTTETAAMFEVGFLEKQDADQVKLAQSNLKYQIDMAERQKHSLENMLKFLLGMPMEATIALTESFDDLLASANDAELSAQPFTINKHIDFRQIEQGLELSELSLANQRAKFYPQLGAFFNHSQNGFSKEFGDILSNEYYPTTIAGLQLKVPIFSSGMRHYQAKQAKLELAKTQSQREMVKQNLQMEAQNAQRNYTTAIENFSLTKQNLELAENIRAATQAKYTEGLVSSLDYAQSESQYLQTLANYVNAAQELFNAKIALDKAYGNY